MIRASHRVITARSREVAVREAADPARSVPRATAVAGYRSATSATADSHPMRR